jgi:hypothetical protein
MEGANAGGADAVLIKLAAPAVAAASLLTEAGESSVSDVTADQSATPTVVLSLPESSAGDGEKQKGERHSRLAAMQAHAEAFASFTSPRIRPAVRSAFDVAPTGERHVEGFSAGSKLTTDAAFASLELTLGTAL